MELASSTIDTHGVFLVCVVSASRKIAELLACISIDIVAV